jgi:aryl-alcohol dehydrogenase-like predicted oxidoreductase
MIMSEADPRLSRRSLFKTTSQAAIAAAVAGPVLAQAAEKAASQPAGADAKKILNYSPKMKYRRMGKTGLMISEVSLGGHWKGRNGERYWDMFSNDEVPDDVKKNRTEVVSACIDKGINYLDITTAAECLSYGAALVGRRDKMHVGADDHRLCIRNDDNCTAATQVKNVEECLRRLKTDYLDIWRVQAKMDGTSQDAHMEACLAAAEQCKKAGKIRHFGCSSHNRKWLQHVVTTFPGVEMIVFPCTAITKKAGGPVVKDNVEERVAYRMAEDVGASIFDAVRKNDVGVVTIKPFAGGQVFKNQVKFPVMGVGLKEENDLARLTLMCILTLHEEITCVVPGLTTMYEVDNAARASVLRGLADLSPAERQWLDQMTTDGLASLPEDYHWLREWDVI